MAASVAGSNAARYEQVTPIGADAAKGAVAWIADLDAKNVTTLSRNDGRSVKKRRENTSSVRRGYFVWSA
jgi:hypothetical protein